MSDTAAAVGLLVVIVGLVLVTVGQSRRLARIELQVKAVHRLLVLMRQIDEKRWSVADADAEALEQLEGVVEDQARDPDS